MANLWPYLSTNRKRKDGFVENSISESHLHRISIPTICRVNIAFGITLKEIFTALCKLKNPGRC